MSTNRIVIDGRALTGPNTGDRTYWRGLIGALPAAAPDLDFLVLSRQPIPPLDLPRAPNLAARVVEAANDRIWTVLALPRAARRFGAALLHVQYTAPPRALIPCPYVTTVHDISFRLYPEWFPWKHRTLMNLTVPPSMRAAAAVITDSESSRRDIEAAYAIPPARLHSIPLGVGSEFSVGRERRGQQETDAALAKERYGLTAPFLLAVAVLQPRKNLTTLAAAFGRAISRTGLPHNLVFVGKAGWIEGREQLREAAVRGGASPDRVIFTGYVPDEDLPVLYRSAAAYAHPSLYEGFGFTPLEAMASGTPTLISDAAAMVEMAGTAALVAPARDIEAWCSAIERILTDVALRARLATEGPERSRHFDWDRTARLTAEVYRSAGNLASVE